MRNRRRLLAAACGAAALGGCGFSLEHGVSNPCRAALPPSPARDDAVLAAWEGIEAARVWDCHAHLIGSGDSGSGIWLNPGMLSVASPLQFAQRLFYLNAGCAHDTPGSVDRSYVERMLNLLDRMRPGAKLVLLAFDRHHAALFDEPAHPARPDRAPARAGAVRDPRAQSPAVRLRAQAPFARRQQALLKERI